MSLVEKVLYGVRKGNEDWREEILSTKPENFKRAKVLAARDGFHRFRVAEIDLSVPPDFAGTVRRLV